MGLTASRHNCSSHEDCERRSVTNYVGKQRSNTTVGDGTYHKIVFAKAGTLAPHAHPLVLVESSSWVKRVIESVDNRASRAPLYVGRRTVDVVLSKLFHILLTDVSNKVVRVPEGMIVAHLADSAARTVGTGFALMETYSKLMVAVHYNRR